MLIDGPKNSAFICSIKFSRMKSFYLFAILLLLLDSCSGVADIGETENKRERIAFEKEQQRVRTMEGLKTVSDSLYQTGDVNGAIQYLDSALQYAETESGSLNYIKGGYLFVLRDYKNAIEPYQCAIDKGYKKDTCFYQKALCYQKLRDLPSTVDQLREAIKLGNNQANELHEQINPERKRVAYYVTRCCDGSTSSAKGRGACSHHGGVCNWNDPEYETYRKY